MEDNENINKHLKNSLDGFLIQPKITSFDEVIKKLERKRKRRFILLFFSGVLLFTIGTTVFYTIDKTPTLLQQNTIVEKNGEVNEFKTNFTPPTSVVEDSKTLSKANSIHQISTPTTKTSDTKTKQKKKIHNSNIKEKSTSTTLSPVSKAPVHSIAKHESKFEESNSALLAAGETVLADELISKKMYLPVWRTTQELIPKNLETFELIDKSEDSVKKVKKIRFLLGPSYNPQFGSYQLSQSKSSTFDDEFSAAYLKNKKEQNAIKFNFSFGLKAGVLLKDKWELLAGINYQRYKQEEVIKQLTISGNIPTVTLNNLGGLNSGQNFDNSGIESAVLGKTYISTYRYLDYSLELNRLVKLNNAMKLKMGVGLHYQQLFLRKNSSMIIAESPDVYYYSSGNNSTINRSNYSFDIKGGVIENLTEKIQIQFCPNFFYSPKSMFKKDYVIQQKNYGLGVEVLLLFKIG